MSTVVRVIPARSPWWLWPQLLSLDGVLVALVWQQLLAQEHQMRVNGYFTWALGLVVWLAYVVDRLVDASQWQQPTLPARHAYHWQWRKALCWVLLPAAAAVVAYLALWQLPEAALWHGVGVGLGVLMYLASHTAAQRGLAQRVLLSAAGLVALLVIAQMETSYMTRLILSLLLLLFMVSMALASVQPRWHYLLPKEMLSSLLFALGCGLVAHCWSIGEHSLLCEQTVLAWVLFMLNLIIIAHSEVCHGVADAASGRVAQRWPAESIYFLLALLLAFCTYLCSHTGQTFLCLASPVVAGLLLLLYLTQEQRSADAQRTLVDAALLLPGVWLLL